MSARSFFAWPAVAGLMLTGGSVVAQPMPGPAGSILVPICGDALHIVWIPMKKGGRAPFNPCPGACHIACARREGEGDNG